MEKNENRPGLSLVETKELVRRAKKGDDEAWQALAERFRPRLCRWAAGRVPADLRGLLGTEDLVQDALLKTLDRVDRLRHSGAFLNYLRRTVLNGIRDEIRRQRTVPFNPDRPPVDPSPSPAERLIGRDLVARYESALAEFPERERAALVGRLEWKLPYSELAANLNYPSPDAARMAISRALVKLSERIREQSNH